MRCNAGVIHSQTQVCTSLMLNSTFISCNAGHQTRHYISLSKTRQPFSIGLAHLMLFFQLLNQPPQNCLTPKLPSIPNAVITLIGYGHSFLFPLPLQPKRKHEREHMMRSHSLRHLTATTTTISSPSWLPKFRSSSGSALASLSFAQNPQENQQQQQKQQTQQKIYCDSSNDDKKSDSNRASSYFPKRGQELELVCESLAYKGKGVCKVADTGFVVLCDRVLPGEKFIGRVTRKKGSYAEVSRFIAFIARPLLFFVV